MGEKISKVKSKYKQRVSRLFCVSQKGTDGVSSLFLLRNSQTIQHWSISSFELFFKWSIMGKQNCCKSCSPLQHGAATTARCPCPCDLWERVFHALNSTGPPSSWTGHVFSMRLNLIPNKKNIRVPCLSLWLLIAEHQLLRTPLCKKRPLAQQSWISLAAAQRTVVMTSICIPPLQHRTPDTRASLLGQALLLPPKRTL